MSVMSYPLCINPSHTAMLEQRRGSTEALMFDRRPLTHDVSARAHSPNETSPNTTSSIDGVRCRACGAHTPVLGADPTCLYCGLPVELPSHVAGRVDELQRHLERARKRAEKLDRELSSEGAGYVNGILAAQLIGILLSLAFWGDLLHRRIGHRRSST